MSNVMMNNLKRTAMVLAVVCFSGVVGGVTAQHAHAGSQASCAPTEDRVGFPDGYADWGVLYNADYFNGRKVVTAYANDVALSVRPGEQFPYGSIIVEEQRNALVENGEPVFDDNGRFIPGDVTEPLPVMRTEKGFGRDYCHPAGEWEFVAYNHDGTYAVPPEQSDFCAECHTQTGPRRDYVFRSQLYFNNHGHGPVANGVALIHNFVPPIVQANNNGTVTWYNMDAEWHRIVLDSDPTVDSGIMRTGSSFTYRFPQPGEYTIHCQIHPRMVATVIVK
jgi:hypothetical protein